MKDKIQPPGSPEPSLTARTSVEELVRLSSSFDGFKRENAVRRLGMIGDPAAIPALIIRANDWVREIASIRRAAVRAFAKLSPDGASRLEVLHKFESLTEGGNVMSPLVERRAGTFFGMTTQSLGNTGTVFKLIVRESE